MIKELILQVLSFFWTLIPYRMKIIILNFSHSFYYRYRYLLYKEKYSDRQKSKKNKISFTLQGDSLVSIIIPTFNNHKRLKSCLEAIRKNTRYKNYEVILVDNNSFSKKSLKVIIDSAHRVIKYSYKFNFSKLNNFAAKFARGEYLLFLNNDTQPLKNWLVPLLTECQKEDVGIVGNKLLYPNNTIQHAGIDFDPKNLQFFHLYQYSPSMIREANYIKEVPAVTGACLMVKRKLFEQAGGFDEDYWWGFQDVDLCFKIRKSGFKIIYTPYSVVYHRQGSTIGHISGEVSLYDSLRLRKKWLPDYLILNSGNIMKSALHKILLIKLLTLGDVVMVTSVIEALRKKYPESEIVFATSHKYKDIIEGNPYLDRVYVCRDYTEDEFNNGLDYYRAITLELLYKENWNLVYQLQIFNLFGGHWRTDYHLRDLYADLANVRIKDEKMHIPVTDQQRSRIKSLINAYVKEEEKIILLHTTSGWRLKDWDYHKYPTLIRKIQDRYRAKFFQIGTDNDAIIEDGNVIHLQGKLTLKETAALMECSDLLICPDSGPMHMATAMGSPLIALFGPTNPSKCGPINENRYICIQSQSCCHLPCHSKICVFRKECAKDISVDIVFDAATKMLETTFMKGLGKVAIA